MILRHREWNWEIEFCENRASVLVLERQDLFSEFVQELWRQSMGGEGRFILSDSAKELSLAKDAECIINPFALDSNNRRITAQIYKEMLENAESGFAEKGMQLHAAILDYLEDLSQELDYPLTFELDYRWAELFKAYNVRVEEQGDSLTEKILCFARLMSKACGTKLFIFVNLESFLNKSEIEFLYEAMFYEKINVLRIEVDTKTSLECEDVLIIDKDLCCIQF